MLFRSLHTRGPPIPILPDLNSDGVPHTEPVAVLDKRSVRDRNKVSEEYLIEWKNLPVAAATWEKAESLRRQHPSFSLS